MPSGRVKTWWKGKIECEDQAVGKGKGVRKEKTRRSPRDCGEGEGSQWSEFNFQLPDLSCVLDRGRLFWANLKHH